MYERINELNVIANSGRAQIVRSYTNSNERINERSCAMAHSGQNDKTHHS